MFKVEVSLPIFNVFSYFLVNISSKGAIVVPKIYRYNSLGGSKVRIRAY